MSLAKTPSTAFSHRSQRDRSGAKGTQAKGMRGEEDVGVKRKVQRGWRSSQAWTFGCLWVAQLFRSGWISFPAGTSHSRPSDLSQQSAWITQLASPGDRANNREELLGAAESTGSPSHQRTPSTGVKMTMHDHLELRVHATLRTLWSTALLWLCVATSGLAAEANSTPLQPVDTSSPRSTFLAFRENVEAAYRRWRLREGRQEMEVEAYRRSEHWT